jgi:zinc transporter 1/2/3
MKIPVVFLLSLANIVAAQSVTSAVSPQVTGCHNHDGVFMCIDANGNEGIISPAPTITPLPSSYTSCHAHGTDTFCMGQSNEVRFQMKTEDHDHESEHQTATVTATTTTNSASGQTTAVTACHFHGTTQFCINGNGDEGIVTPAPTNTQSAPAEYTGCHQHGSTTFCMNGDQEVQFLSEAAAGDNQDGDGHDHNSQTSSESSESGISCHFHAGVEHCVDANGVTIEKTCEFVSRDRNINLRVGLLFAVLAATAFAVSLPLFLNRFANVELDGIIFTIFKQFGTGVILSTSLVHLLIHSQLFFQNECLGKLSYESTATAIAMAGLFLAFLFEYTFSRLVSNRQRSLVHTHDCESDQQDSEKAVANSTAEIDSPAGHTHGPLLNPHDRVSVFLIEAGIIFHSILIGLTLSVSGDNGLIVLFIVILFHQMFEGIALGSRISGLGNNASFWEKLIMCAFYAVTTPIGMGIGIGVVSVFNGNDKSTIIAIGTIDSFSAGILLWTGIVDMLAMDWIFGPLARAGLFKTLCAMTSLVAGMILMSFLGKWT